MSDYWPEGCTAPQRRIVDMRKLYGERDDRRCGDCAHFVRHRMANSWAKCDLSRMSASKATDWRVRWPACGRFE